MSLVVILIAALAGLAVFALLVAGEPGPIYFRLLATGTVAAGIVGLSVLRVLPEGGPAVPPRLWLALGLLWLCWIGLVAFIAQTLRARLPQSTDILLLGGGLGTLAPVAGFFLALTSQ